MRLTTRLCSSFQALVTRGVGNANVEKLSISDLPTECQYKQTKGPCDMLVEVEYSTLNYKDALVVSGRYPGLKPPMVGGCDLVGQVVEDSSGCHKAGERIVINGWGVGTDHYGGFSRFASLRSSWALRLPSGMTSLQAASIGTAGYTAMLCIQAMERSGLKPGRGPVLVTGATGGVGSISVILLTKLGYEVAAVSGKAQAEEEYLNGLGAKEVLDRSLFEGEARPLGKELYAGCVDSCGGVVLANVLPQIKYGGVVSACGLASGMGLVSTVAPFILRGVTLAGVEAALLPLEGRIEAYNRFGPMLTQEDLSQVTSKEMIVGLSELPTLAGKMLDGNIRGRYVVDPAI